MPNVPWQRFCALLAAAKSQEFATIVLRRSEKKALNAINHAEERMRFFVPSAAKPQKPKERIQSAAEKIFILVCILPVCPSTAVKPKHNLSTCRRHAYC